MYELEPAPGIKASRVVGLAEDIARNMSAISARVSPIPGRTVMGIELPNQDRQMVALKELAACTAFAEAKGNLPIILGKDIAGEPIIADLAPCPTCWSRGRPVRVSPSASTSFCFRCCIASRPPNCA
jgi:S-DNA-T family DNA segregation ATPase FtsK/SpoIIIE